MLLDDLLFKIIELDDGRLDTVLGIPTSKVLSCQILITPVLLEDTLELQSVTRP